MKLKAELIASGMIVAVVGFTLFWAINKQHIQINNKTCPVSGKPVNNSDTYIYKGKQYKLCSCKCKQHLSENPEKYLSE